MSALEKSARARAAAEARSLETLERLRDSLSRLEAESQSFVQE